MSGPKRNAPTYNLRDEGGKQQPIKVSLLVASLFVRNPYGIDDKVHVHHRDGNPLNNHWLDLEYKLIKSHVIHHIGIPVYHHNADCELVEYGSVSLMCDALDIKSARVYDSIKKEKPICNVNNGLVNIIAIKGCVDDNNNTIYMGYRISDKKDLVDETDPRIMSAVAFFEGLMEAYGDV